MAIVHYLDSARLGLMTPTARDRHKQLADFATSNAASTTMDQLLIDGGSSWSRDLQDAFPALACFPGIEGFRTRLKRELICDDAQSVLLASTSATHIRLAASLLFTPCDRVLTTDLCWDVYRDFLTTYAADRRKKLVVVPVREFIQGERPTLDQLTSYLADEYERRNCQGLFLTAVSHDGIRLSAGDITSSIRQQSEVFFSVIDGAQEFAQVDHSQSVTAADLYLTSSHKWLGGYIPLSIGVYGRNRSANRIERIVSHMLQSKQVDDPLLRLTWDANSEFKVTSQSTANVAALFSCDGSLNDLHFESHIKAPLSQSDLAPLADGLQNTNWRLRSLPSEFQSRTLLLQPRDHKPKRTVREAFAAAGLAVTAYDSGSVRLSIPNQNWDESIQADVVRRIQMA